ncbi:MAG: sugar ABC transporter permease [Acetatifactor sp.]|nr:sugar ABC transporter permease [Acetatifactor sp.]
MGEKEASKERIAGKLYYFSRVSALLSVVLMLFPGINPARICGYINKNMSLFTSGIAYSELVSECQRAFTKGWLQESSFRLLFASCLIICIGIVLTGICACMSLGNVKMKKAGNIFGITGGALELIGLIGIVISYCQVAATSKPEKVLPCFQGAGYGIFLVLALTGLTVAIVNQLLLRKITVEEKMEMDSKYKLFLMFLPFLAAAFVFSYLPLWGWRYAFFDYTSGSTLSMDKFVGFKWFTILFQNEATRQDIVRVLRNTLAMSGLGIATSWVAMAFAIFLSEIKCGPVRRFVQTFTTIPNFISWVLVYALALAIFSSDGFISSIMMQMGVWETGENLLMNPEHTWLKMLFWGMWKGVGWSAIIYIAGISGIDQQLYEAATVDGAGRFQKIWHVTVPGLIPTYMVLLLMSVAGILSNGMEQYLVFKNPINANAITVLDLYVYELGIGSGAIPLSTVVGMVKSLVSVALLFMANGISKLIRGESII